MTRSASIPQTLVPEVLRLQGEGLGARRIARSLERLGCWTTKSSVHRLLTGQPPYTRGES